MDMAISPEGEAEMQDQVRALGKAVRSGISVACVGMMVLLGGCQNFFLCQKASCPSSGNNTTTSGDLAYVANGTKGTTYVSGYDIGKGALTALPNSQYTLGITPGTMVVTQNNKFLYATENNGTQSVIRGWTINTDGSISAFSSGSNALVTQATVAAMDVSADGQWLVVANAIDSISTPTITVYAINSSTGALSAPSTVPSSTAYAVPATSSVNTLKVAPSGQYIALAMSTGGVLVFPFNTSNGAIGTSSVTDYQIKFGLSTVGAFDVAIDANNYLYIATTAGITSYSVSSAGAPGNTEIATTPTVANAGGPYSVALNGTSYLYAGALDGSTNRIYCYSTTNGKLTALSTPTVTAPTTTTKLAVDSTRKYLLASGYDTSAGLELYTIGTGGLLSATASAGTSTTIGTPTVIALTH